MKTREQQIESYVGILKTDIDFLVNGMKARHFSDKEIRRVIARATAEKLTELPEEGGEME